MAINDTNAQDDPWLTLAEIAEELRMSPATIRSWISKGTLVLTDIEDGDRVVTDDGDEGCWTKKRNKGARSLMRLAARTFPLLPGLG